MAEKLRLKIITPEKLVFDGEVEELVAPGQMGEFGVLPGHVPFLSVLFPGRLRFKTVESGENTLIIHGGLADVKDDTVSILTDQSENPAEVDVAAARKDAEAFQRELDDLQDAGDSEREELDRKLRIARARAGE
ncbi:MAG: ATP synthase F1 subunit epsilon [Candidatus Dadabacteria bacterium]|nr:ATP synthase F1 subunit epsilon [Candidatus Dadabacteria bacterium]MDE0477287.1 ATP synthase F1 subunit epsilon [Candidatus Dadabacteria bacterium]